MKDIVKKSKGMSRRRLQHIYDLAKTKTSCEGGDTSSEDALGNDPEAAMKRTVW